MRGPTHHLVAQQSTAQVPVGAGRAFISALGAAAVYFGVREIVEGSPQSATANAERIMRFERWMGIGVERSVQEFMLDHPTLVEAFNRAYVWLHWPFLVVALVIVFRRDRGAYSRLFGALVASGILGLVVFASFPVSPPRFESGFVGTVSQSERQHFLPYPAGWSNRFASMPSFHAGWTLIAGLVLAKTLRSRLLKIMALLPAPMVAVAVVATGNHYVLDVVVGCAIAIGALLVTTWHPADGVVPARLRFQPVLFRRHADAP
jgi:membrane-associated phospholipid phosphatase